MSLSSVESVDKYWTMQESAYRSARLVDLTDFDENQIQNRTRPTLGSSFSLAHSTFGMVVQEGLAWSLRLKTVFFLICFAQFR